MKSKSLYVVIGYTGSPNTENYTEWIVRGFLKEDESIKYAEKALKLFHSELLKQYEILRKLEENLGNEWANYDYERELKKVVCDVDDKFQCRDYLTGYYIEKTKLCYE